MRSVRLIGGAWHGDHFDPGPVSRPIRSGVALVIVFEDNDLPASDVECKQLGDEVARTLIDLNYKHVDHAEVVH